MVEASVAALVAEAGAGAEAVVQYETNNDVPNAARRIVMEGNGWRKMA